MHFGVTRGTSSSHRFVMHLLEKQKGNIKETFQATQSALLRYLLPMLPVFPLLYSRSAYHVPNVPDVTFSSATYGTFAPSGTWYTRVILIKLAFAFVTFCESNAKTLLTSAQAPIKSIIAAVVPTAFPIRQYCLNNK